MSIFVEAYHLNVCHSEWSVDEMKLFLIFDKKSDFGQLIIIIVENRIIPGSVPQCLFKYGVVTSEILFDVFTIHCWFRYPIAD